MFYSVYKENQYTSIMPTGVVSSLVSFALFAGAFATSSQAYAENMYWLEDKNGQTLLTNRKPKGKLSKYNKQVKVTWYKDTNVHEYKDWGKTEYAVPKKYKGNRGRFDHLIAKSANKYGLDPALMKAIMHTESGFNPRARSPVGAQGLMQLMPPTAKDMGVRNPWDPAQNIDGAAKYLRYLKKLFKGDYKLMLAGYNAGQGNVKKYGGIPPFKETRNYVKKVLSRYNKLYKGKSFVATNTRFNNANVQQRSQANTQARNQQQPQTIREVRSNPIKKYQRNNVNYLKSSPNKARYVQANYRQQSNTGYPQRRVVNSAGQYNNQNLNRSYSNHRNNNTGQDRRYNASAFEALKQGKQN